MVALRNIKTLVCRKLVVMFIFGPDLLINTFYERTNFTFLYKSNISRVYSTRNFDAPEKQLLVVFLLQNM
jgi:hypothetical protein